MTAATSDQGLPIPLRHLLNGGVAAFYGFFLMLTYRELSKIWGYLGFWYTPPEPSVTALSVAAAGLLGAMLPARSWTVVGFAKWVLCFRLFIPTVTIPPQQGTLLTDDLLLLETLALGSAVVFIAFLRDGAPFPPLRLSRQALWQGVIVCWILGNLSILAVFGGSLSLASLEEVYDQRSSTSGLGGAAIVYVMGFMSGAVNPFLLVIGLAQRRWSLVAMALAGQVLIYSTLAAKVVLRSTLLTVGTFLAFRHGRVAFTRIRAAILLFAILGPWITAPRVIMGGLIGALSDLIYFRILVLPGALVGIYSEFFLNYPVTKLSHSLVGRAFSTYPYGSESVGQVIGRYVTPTLGAANNYNANFIAADGIAGFSTWGVPVIFVFAAAWLWFASRLVGQGNRQIVCAMLMPFITSLADASLFTAILTNGGAAAALLLYFYRLAEDTKSYGVASPRVR
jgi:hypothetical protein